MSYIRFHTNFQQNRVEIPSCKRLPPNPHIGGGLEAIRRATAPPSQTTGTDSECPPESRDDKALRYRLIATDQRSFLTGSAAADLQAAHIINAVCLKTERKEQVVSDAIMLLVFFFHSSFKIYFQGSTSYPTKTLSSASTPIYLRWCFQCNFMWVGLHVIFIN